MRLGSTFIVGAIFLTSLPAWSRWATWDDAGWELLGESGIYQVKKDGTYRAEIEERWKVLKESGKSYLGTKRLTYNSDTSDLQVQVAKSIDAGQANLVPKKFIEDRPVASAVHGFDQNNQVSVTFPNLMIGSETDLKYTIHERESAFHGLFSESFIFGWGEPEKASYVEIHSEIPIYFEANDPEHALSIEPSKSGGSYVLKINQTKPIYRGTLDEASSIVDPKTYTWVKVSTQKNWSAFVGETMGKYEGVLSQTLPKKFLSIAQHAEEKKSFSEKINTVTSELAAIVNYKGDWRTNHGRYIPHDLREIAESGLGDCKDFSASTAAILRKAGIEAHVAWVVRGEKDNPFPWTLPGKSDFNHAIVAADHEGKRYWIDPTNFTSFAPYIYPDIADRQAYVLDPANPGYFKIPKTNASDSKIAVIQDIFSNGDYGKLVKSRIDLGGSAALGYTGVDLSYSKKFLDASILRLMGNEEIMLDTKVEPYELSSRIVKDISLQAAFIEKNNDILTSSGPAIALASPTRVSDFLVRAKDRVSDLWLGTPSTLERKFRFHEITPVGDRNLSCSVKSDWVDGSRQVEKLSDGIQITDSLVIKQARIGNDELHGDHYSKLQNRLRDCFREVAIVYLPGENDETARRTLSSVDPAPVREAWIKRLADWFSIRYP